MFLVDWYSGSRAWAAADEWQASAKNFTPRLTSAGRRRRAADMVDCVKASTPGVLSYDFTVSTNAFSAGKTAMMLMWSTIAGPVYNPKTSKVAHVVGVTTTPAARRGYTAGSSAEDGAWESRRTPSIRPVRGRF